MTQIDYSLKPQWLHLMLPQARDGSNFSTQLFDRYQRSEKALLSSTISHLVKGVDEEIRYFRNRKLSAAYPYVIVDARYEKVRVNRRVISSGGCNWWYPMTIRN